MVPGLLSVLVSAFFWQAEGQKAHGRAAWRDASCSRSHATYTAANLAAEQQLADSKTTRRIPNLEMQVEAKDKMYELNAKCEKKYVVFFGWFLAGSRATASTEYVSEVCSKTRSFLSFSLWHLGPRVTDFAGPWVSVHGCILEDCDEGQEAIKAKLCRFRGVGVLMSFAAMQVRFFLFRLLSKPLAAFY